MKATVILNTFNQPRVLALTLYSLLRQSETDFEIVIADDGSREDTWKMIEKFQKLYNKRLSHQWQEAKGARRSRILNRAIGVAKASRIIVIEENSFVHRNFVRDHVSMGKKCDMFLGARMFLNPDLSESVIEHPAKIESLEFWRRSFFSVRSKKLNGFNLSFAKDWFHDIGGFDESVFEPGAELRDFYSRMQDAGAKIVTSSTLATQWCLQDYMRGANESLSSVGRAQNSV